MIPDHLRKDLNLIFVGFNPSIVSGETGHHYANKNNRFWKILYASGLTDRLYRAEEDHLLLHLGYGLTNIVERPTKSAAEITKHEYEEGRIRLKEKLVYYQPKIVCFVGKGVYKEYSQIIDIPWGKQKKSVLPNMIDFVAPSSSGLVRMKMDEIVSIYKDLHRLVKKLGERQ